MRRDRFFLLTAVAVLALPVFAKLPALSDDAKAKAAVVTAKTAWSDKVGAYQLCQVQDRTAERYRTSAKDAGKEVPAAVATPPCADPGPFVPPAGLPAAAAASGPVLEAASAHSPTNTAVAPPTSTNINAKPAPSK